jgi:signal transduction histidine kinase
MTFIVQDLLDYAQIKAGKFRKNISIFNIRESIEKVMCIQRKKAEERGIDFSAVYKNFS